MAMLVWLLIMLLNVYIGLIIVGAIISWFNLDPRHPVVQTIDRLTDPMLAPIRRVLGTAGGIDFSPLVAILILSFIQRLLGRIL